MTRAGHADTLFYAIFFATGTTTAALGVLLARGGIHASADASVGSLLATQFLGGSIGALLVLRRARVSVVLGLALLACACLLLFALERPVPWVVLLLGIALGLVMTATSVVASERSANRGSTLELLNVFWPLGAAVCAPLLALLERHGNAWRVFGIGSAFFFLAFLLTCLTKGAPDTAAKEEIRTPEIQYRRVGVLCALALLAVGVETGIAAWLPTFAMRIGSTAGMMVAAPACYWSGSVLSRLGAAILLQRVAVGRLMFAATLGSILSGALLVALPGSRMLYLVSFAAGASAAPLYPAILSAGVALRGKNIIFVCGGLGSVFMPWAIGRVSHHSDSLRVAMLLPLLGGVAILLLLKGAAFPQRRPPAADAA